MDDCLEKTMTRAFRQVRECTSACIRLLPGSAFYEAQERMRAYVLSLDSERMLYHFRKASGMDTGDAQPLGGWEAEDCQLRSHTTGHYLSALALLFRAVGDESAKEKAAYIISELAKCQQAFEETGNTAEGFLSGYSEEQFDLLEDFTPYPDIWAPYYTMHKLFAGLLDCYVLLGNASALEIAKKLGMWVYRRLSRLCAGHREKMWEMYIAGEFGGMGVVMTQLYELTGDEVYLEGAKLFYNSRLFVPLREREDRLDGMHANQHIPQVLGAMEFYKVTGDKELLEMSRFFWETVTKDHCYAPGGTGEGECFHGSRQIGAFITEKTMETCASYNMLKLTKELYQYEPDTGYMDYYENVLLNHILASQEKQATGESTYFLPLKPGVVKEFLHENSCCHGTGMESQFKYGEGIFYRDGKAVYINLFLPCVMEEEDVFIRIEKDICCPKKIRIFVKSEVISAVKIRKPGWAGEDWSLTLDGERAASGTDTDDNRTGGSSIAGCMDEGGYLNVLADYTKGREIVFTVPHHFRLCRTPDDPLKAAVFYGPYMLVMLSEKDEFQTMPFRDGKIGDHMRAGEKPLEFVCEGTRWIPLWKVSEEAYHAYVLCESS